MVREYPCCVEQSGFHGHDGENQLYFNGSPYYYRCEFKWRRPKLILYRAATRRRFAVVLNRYPGIVIGAALQVGSRVLSLVWGRPGRSIEISKVDELGRVTNEGGTA